VSRGGRASTSVAAPGPVDLDVQWLRAIALGESERMDESRQPLRGRDGLVDSGSRSGDRRTPETRARPSAFERMRSAR
jgi:hypothetical protein